MPYPQDSHSLARAIVETVRHPLLALDGNLRVQFANAIFCEHFQVLVEETEKQFLYDLWNGKWNIPKLQQLLEEVLPKQQEMQDFKVEHEFPHLGQRTMLLNPKSRF